MSYLVRLLKNKTRLTIAIMPKLVAFSVDLRLTSVGRISMAASLRLILNRKYMYVLHMRSAIYLVEANDLLTPVDTMLKEVI